MRRPKHLHGFYGQRPKVRHLLGQLKGAQALGEPCPHLLIVGPSGMGKTKLARALAVEAGTECREVHGKATPRHLCEALVTLKKGDFLFLDEAHTLARDAQESLYEVIDAHRMADHLADTTKGKRDKDGKLLIEPVTIILATNQPTKLLKALRQRMDETVTLSDYREEELVQIVSSAASDMKVVVSPQAAGKLARASQGQPRRAMHILKGMRRHFHADLGQQLTVADVREYLRDADTDERGLDARQQTYLRKLDKRGAASLATLASLLGTDEEDILDSVEPGLDRLDYVRKGQGGRSLTPKGKRWAERDKEKRLAAKRQLKQRKEGHDENR